MTVTYSLDVATSTFLGLHKLLFRWRGSIWKSTYQELSLWLLLYSMLSATYRLMLTKPQQRIFEDITVFFYTYGDFIPITFMLGFYVSTVFARWGEIFNNLGWIDSSALAIAAYIEGSDENSRLLRRSCVRYLVLMQAMVFRDVSMSVKKRFPTIRHLVTAGLMTEMELVEMAAIDSPHIKYWQPVHWVNGLLKQARNEGKIASDIIYVDLMEKVRQYRVMVMTLTLYDWVPVPLVYTQVVNLAVRSYFFIALMGRQYLLTERDFIITKTIDLYVPIMTILQFLFYIGWMKVAEVLLNPLGEDDDDFECNYILDRNLQVGFSIVDDAFNRRPDLEKDIFWYDKTPEPLYTLESAARPLNPNIGSCTESQIDPLGERFMLKRRDLPNNNPSEIIGFQPVGVKRRCNSNVTPRSSISNHSSRIGAFFKHRLAHFRKRENSLPTVSEIVISLASNGENDESGLKRKSSSNSIILSAVTVQSEILP